LPETGTRIDGFDRTDMSTSTPSVTKKDDGSMEVEIAWTLPLTTC
jgi:hypothetical protein